MQRHAVECYRQSYRGRRMEGRISEPLYPGIAQLLHNLHCGSWQLAVATGKSERGLRACLETHGILDLFVRSEEHTSELQSLMRISYAVFCLKKKKQTTQYTKTTQTTLLNTSPHRHTNNKQTT